MANSSGYSFPSSGISPGDLHYNLSTGGVYRYLGGDPADTSHNWLLVGGALATDPDTTGWGTRQDGATWFNSTSNVTKVWNGTSIVEGGGGGGLPPFDGAGKLLATNSSDNTAEWVYTTEGL